MKLIEVERATNIVIAKPLAWLVYGCWIALTAIATAIGSKCRRWTGAAIDLKHWAVHRARDANHPRRYS